MLIILNHSQNFPSVGSWIKSKNVLQSDLTNWTSYSSWEARKTEKTGREVSRIQLTTIVGAYNCISSWWEGRCTYVFPFMKLACVKDKLQILHILGPQAQSLHTASCSMSVYRYDSRKEFILPLCSSPLPILITALLHLLDSPPQLPFLHELSESSLSPHFLIVPRVRRHWGHSFPWLFPHLIPYTHKILRQKEILVWLIIWQIRKLRSGQFKWLVQTAS